MATKATENIDTSISANDHRLMDEAIERISAVHGGQHLNKETIKTVLAAELRRGRRDLFSLIRAGQRVLDEQ